MTTWEACSGERGGHTKCKEMWFDTREVLGEVCAFCGKGRECPPAKAFSQVNQCCLHLHSNNTVGVVAEEVRSVRRKFGFLQQHR